MRDNEMLIKEKVKELGFTDSMIAKLLPDPIEKRRIGYGSPYKLWDRKAVEAAMATPKFAELSARAAKKREAAAKGVAKRRARCAADFDERIARIKVGAMPIGAVRRNAREARMRRAWEQGDYGFDAQHADKGTLDRWCVNYIRHELTDYDADLYEGKGQIGIGEEYARYRNAVLDAIADAYPMLADECRRQSRP